MLQVFQSWFSDPLVQSVLISPLAGAIFGALFSGTGSPPSSNAPVTIQQTTIVFKKTINVTQSSGKSAAQDDGMAILIAGVLLIAGITWGYSRYSTEILGYWLSGLFCAATFTLSAGIAAAFRARYSGAEWVWHIFAPMVFVGLSFYFVHLAELGIIADAREAARRNGFIDFYFKVLKNDHRYWLLMQIIGVCFGILATLVAALRSMHYLALMNLRAGGQLYGVWHFSARTTLPFRGAGGIMVLLILSAAAYFTLSGTAYRFIQHTA